MSLDFTIVKFRKKSLFSKTYLVRDLDDEVIYTIKMSWFNRYCEIYDDEGKAVARVVRTTIFPQTDFKIAWRGKEEIVAKQMAFFKTKVIVAASWGNYFIEGKGLNKGYTYHNDDVEVARLSQPAISFSRRGNVAIRADEDVDFIITLVFLTELIILSRQSKG